jgi:hypothetical protein
MNTDIRELSTDDLELVAGGIAERQAWVSLAAAHGFNPQPDPPAIWNSLTLAGTAGHT